jgi:uncharacterized membrane protein
MHVILCIYAIVCVVVLQQSQAAILHSLTQRFAAGHIYTFTANAILLAVNPFKVSASACFMVSYRVMLTLHSSGL